MDRGNKKIAILSRYKEQNSLWKSILEQFGYKIIVFNKFEGDNLIPNIGREGHTYLYYIVNNYKKLPYEILFSQYDPIDHFKENTVWESKNYHTNIKKFLTGFLYDFIGIRPTDFDYVVRDRPINWIEYCKKIFDKFEENDINRLISCGANLNGVFRVSRRSILKRPLSFYQNCLDLLSNDIDPDEGYFFERIWKYIFTNYGCNNNAYNIFVDNYFLFGMDYGIDDRWTRKSNPISSNFSGNIISDRKWKNNSYGHIFLHNSGLIMSNYKNTSLYSSPNEVYWSINDDHRLRFHNAMGSITSIFDLQNYSYPLYGYFYEASKKKSNFHFLKPKMFM
jgi:hypothetical protein